MPVDIDALKYLSLTRKGYSPDKASEMVFNERLDQYTRELEIKKLKVDHEGLDAHNKRMENGFRLFGKYYQNLWD